MTSGRAPLTSPPAPTAQSNSPHILSQDKHNHIYEIRFHTRNTLKPVRVLYGHLFYSQAVLRVDDAPPLQFEPRTGEQPVIEQPIMQTLTQIFNLSPRAQGNSRRSAAPLGQTSTRRWKTRRGPLHPLGRLATGYRRRRRYQSPGAPKQTERLGQRHNGCF
jgi:hypothetical protein